MEKQEIWVFPLVRPVVCYLPYCYESGFGAALTDDLAAWELKSCRQTVALGGYTLT